MALIFMLLDHVAEFISGFSIWFHWIGRLSAPIFLFCCVWSFDYTRNKKMYLMRLYIASVIMSVIQSIYDIPNNFFRTLFSLCLVLYLFEIYKNKKEWIRYFIIYISWQFISTILTVFLINISSNLTESIFIYVFPTLCGNIFNLEGGFIFVVLGIIFYLFKNNTVKLAISFTVFDLFYFFVSTTSIIGVVLGKMGQVFGFNISDLIDYIMQNIVGLGQMDLGGSPIFENYQWMMIFSLFFILIYNGKEGKKHKWVFYIFYPAHILILCLMFGVN